MKVRVFQDIPAYSQDGHGRDEFSQGQHGLVSIHTGHSHVQNHRVHLCVLGHKQADRLRTACRRQSPTAVVTLCQPDQKPDGSIVVNDQDQFAFPLRHSVSGRPCGRRQCGLDRPFMMIASQGSVPIAPPPKSRSPTATCTSRSSLHVSPERPIAHNMPMHKTRPPGSDTPGIIHLFSSFAALRGNPRCGFIPQPQKPTTLCFRP